MKIGMRKPSIKKSISARTTGKAKRAVKKSVNPLYGKKGIGFVKSPSKSIKNKYTRKQLLAFLTCLNEEIKHVYVKVVYCSKRYS